MRRLAITTAAMAITLCAAAEAVRMRPLLSIYVDAKGGGLRSPSAVAFGRDVLAVGDTGNGRIVTYAVAAETVRAQGELALAQVPVPIALAYLSTGEMLALDGRARRIARLDASGAFTSFLEPPGLPGPFVPRSLAVGPQDRIHVLDVGGGRLLVLDAAGAVQATVPLPAELGFASDVAVGPRGEAYVLDSVGRRVWVARSGEKALTPLGDVLTEDVEFPTAIAADEGRLFLLDENGGGVVVLGQDGSFRGRPLAMGWKEGFLRYPVDACVDTAGRVFVAERGNNRIQMFAVR